MQTVPARGNKPSAACARVSASVIAVPVRSVRQDADMNALMRALSTHSVLPVVDRKNRLLGIIRDQDVLLSSDWQQAIVRHAVNFFNQGQALVTLSPRDTVETALERFGQVDQSLIPIVDARGRYTGECASRTQLYKLLHGLLRPARVGGLATPLGVYMTSGYYAAGAGWPGLVATGLMFGLVMHALDWISLAFYSLAAAFFPAIQVLALGDRMILQMGFMLTTLLALLRISPISGLHAAEHMTINAIEDDLDLSEATVARQPREHARCGTNLMVLLGGVQLIGISIAAYYDQMTPLGLFFYVCFWAFILMKYWRRAGLWLQRHFTTRPPSPAELASGLKAGRELLQKFADQPHPVPGFWMRLWGSGLPLMLISFAASAWLVGLLLEKLGI